MFEKDNVKLAAYLMNKWLPLSASMFDCVIETLPNPIEA